MLQNPIPFKVTIFKIVDGECFVKNQPTRFQSISDIWKNSSFKKVEAENKVKCILLKFPVSWKPVKDQFFAIAKTVFATKNSHPLKNQEM